jgi:hypothetical protein
MLPLATRWNLPQEFCYRKAYFPGPAEADTRCSTYTHARAVSLSLYTRSRNVKNVSNLQHSAGASHGRMLVHSMSQQLRMLFDHVVILLIKNDFWSAKTYTLKINLRSTPKKKGDIILDA